MLRDTLPRLLVSLDASLVSSGRGEERSSDLLFARKGPRNVRDPCKGFQTSSFPLFFDMSLHDDWLEREFLVLPLCVTSPFSWHGRQAETVQASQAFLVGDVVYAMDYPIMMAMFGGGYWCMGGTHEAIMGEPIASMGSSELYESAEWTGQARAWVWDHLLKEQFELLSKKLETAIAFLDNIKKELDMLQQRCMEGPPAKRAKVAETLGNERPGSLLAIGSISTPYPDSPADEAEDLPGGLPMVDLVGEEDEDKAAPSAEDDDMNGTGDGDVDEYPRDHQTFRLKTSSRSRRTYSIGYLDNQTTVGDLHFEFARVSKRGARQFSAGSSWSYSGWSTQTWDGGC